MDIKKPVRVVDMEGGFSRILAADHEQIFYGASRYAHYIARLINAEAKVMEALEVLDLLSREGWIKPNIDDFGSVSVQISAALAAMKGTP